MAECTTADKNDSKFTGRGGGTVFADSKIDFHLDSKGKQLLTGNADFRLQASVNTTASEGHDFLDSGFDPEFSFGITIRRIGAGLENLGNTCFLNSVLQCLTYTEPLAAYLQSGMHRISCRIAGFCALCAIQKHVSQALQSTGRILAPKDLVSNLRCISRNFRNARQEDAHEYMVHLLESMHKCCIPKGVPSESPSAYEKSLVHKIFGGRLQSQVKCMQCSYRSNTFDPFLDLSLEIAKVDSLHKALLNFTATEQLDGGERQYQCQHCKQKVNATKQLTVYKAPYVLTVHLKRFCAHDPGRKIDKKVHFTPSLNLKPFVSGSYEGDLKYILYGVLVHAGYSTHSGHYYSFVRTASGIWYRVDDNRVVAVGERTVLEQKAYMLFYYRDRTNACPRKPVHARKTEKLAEVGLRNEMLSSSIQRVKSGVLDVSVTNLFSCAYTSAAAVKKDELNVSLTEDTRLEEKSFVLKQNQNASTIAENKKKERDCSELSIAPSVEERRVNALSVINPGALNREREQLSPLVPPVLVSGEDVCVSNGCSNEPKEEENPSKATSYSNCTTLQKPATEASTGMTLEKVEDVAIGSATFVFPDDKIAVDSCLKVSLNGLTESSSSPILSNTPSHMIAADQKYRQKVKKRGLKFQLWSMHLGSNILYRASLKSMRKKKKTKLRRKRSLESNNLSKEEIDMKPSTSEETRASVHPRKKVRSCSDRHNHDTFMEASKSLDEQLVGGDIRNGELKERLHQYGAVRATDKSTLKRPRSNCCLEVDTCEARDPSDLNYTNRKSMQNGLMNMVTRGLEETIVASWDGVDLPLSHGVHFDSRELVSIGYAPDELDEEYDRGKKKTRSTSNSSFDGKNSFQIIAGKKKQW